MKRESNIEFCRIVAMLMVLLLHANYFSLGGVDLHDIKLAPLDSFLKALSEQLCIICVNVFILISGWFGIRANIKGAVSLLFQVFFYHLLICCFVWLGGGTIPLKTIIIGFYFGRPYWFIISYLILYAITPILNAFIESATPRLVASVLISFFLMEFIYGWATNVAAFNGGYSTISFIGLYLLAQFIRRYLVKLQNISICTNFILYLVFSTLPVGLFFITGRQFNMIAYSSPFVILSSVFFFLAFNKMKISNRVINYFACSALSIYIVHLHPLVYQYFINFMNIAYNALGGYGYTIFVIIFAICFGICCVLIDKIRIFIWNFLCNSIINKTLSNITNIINSIYSRVGI